MAPEFHDLPIASGRIPVPVSRSPAQSATRSSRRSSAGTSLPARGSRSAETWRTGTFLIRTRCKEAGKLLVPVYLHKPRDALRQRQLFRDPAPAMALEKLRDDDRVVQDGVGSQAMIFLEGHDEASQIVAGDRVDRDAVAEELSEAVEHGFIFAMRVGFFQRIDLLQVFSDGDVQRGLLDSFAG